MSGKGNRGGLLVLVANATLIAIAVWRGWAFSDVYAAYLVQAAAIVASVVARELSMPAPGGGSARPRGPMAFATPIVCLPLLAFGLVAATRMAAESGGASPAAIALASAPFVANEAWRFRVLHGADVLAAASGEPPDWSSQSLVPLLALVYPLMAVSTLHVSPDAPAALAVLMSAKAWLDWIARVQARAS